MVDKLDPETLASPRGDGNSSLGASPLESGDGERCSLGAVFFLFVFAGVVAGGVSSLTLTSCSGEGVDAPRTLGAYETRPQDCPSTSTVTAEFHRAREAGNFGSLAIHIEKIAFDDGGINVFLRLGLIVLNTVGGETLLDVFIGVDEGEGIARLIPHIGNVFDYFSGDGPLTAADQHPLLVGPHYAPVASTFRVLTQCEVSSTLSVTKKILELEVIDDAGNLVPWIDPAFDALVEVAADPNFVALIEELELEDESPGGGGIRVGRDAFILIGRLVTGNIAADNFDLEFLRGILDDALVFRLPEETGSRERLSHLIDVFEPLVNPENDIFPFIQSYVRCINDEDEAGAFAGMLYDYLTVDTLDYVVFLQDIDRVGSDRAAVPLRENLIAVIGALETEPALTRDALTIAARFIDDDIVRQTIPAAFALHDDDVLISGIEFLRAFILGCEQASSPLDRP